MSLQVVGWRDQDELQRIYAASLSDDPKTALSAMSAMQTWCLRSSAFPPIRRTQTFGSCLANCRSPKSTPQTKTASLSRLSAELSKLVRDRVFGAVLLASEHCDSFLQLRDAPDFGLSDECILAGAAIVLAHDAATFWEPFISVNCSNRTPDFVSFFVSGVPFQNALQSPNVEWAKARFLPAVVADIISDSSEVCGLPQTTDAERDAVVDHLVAFVRNHSSWELALGFELRAHVAAGAKLFERLSPLFDWSDVSAEPDWCVTPFGDLPAGPPRLFADWGEVDIVQPDTPDELDPRLRAMTGLKGLDGARELFAQMPQRSQRPHRRQPYTPVWNPGKSVQPPRPERPGVFRRQPRGEAPIATDFMSEAEQPVEHPPEPRPPPGMPGTSVVKPQIRPAMIIVRGSSRDRPK